MGVHQCSFVTQARSQHQEHCGCLDGLTDTFGHVLERRQLMPLMHGDALTLYSSWGPPRVIISDGPYGINGYKGDLRSEKNLPIWYKPHVQAWYKYAPAGTTLWFWNTEVGWAHVHHTIIAAGWEYRGCNIWDKGIAHIAGNCNSRTMRKFPVVTELCAHYIKRGASMQWMRSEWERSGIPLYKANEAAGVKNAASRKYLTLDSNLWYPPPTETMALMVDFLGKHGDPKGKPYFHIDGAPWTRELWDRERAVFHLEQGITNVWASPPLRSPERLRLGGKTKHPNQKPMLLIRQLIRTSSDPGDVVWDPFSGTGTTAVCAHLEGRSFFGSEIDPDFFKAAQDRIKAIIPA